MVLNITGRSDIALYVPFNEGSGGTLHDYGIDLLTGTIVNDDQIWYKTKDGKYSLWHDGITDHTFFTPTTSLTSYPFTLAGWMKSDAANSTDTVVTIADSSTSSEQMIIGGGVSGTFKVRLRARNGSGTSDLYGTTTMVADKWYFVTGVFRSATDREVYLDGISEGTQSTSRTFPPSNIRFGIGGTADSSPSDWMNGEISDCWIFNRTLSDEEIKALYRATYRN